MNFKSGALRGIHSWVKAFRMDIVMCPVTPLLDNEVCVRTQDVYLQTNTLAALANLAPHCAGLSSHASQRLISLTEMLSRRLQRLERASDSSLSPTYIATGVNSSCTKNLWSESSLWDRR